jgi:hypothetical protein
VVAVRTLSINAGLLTSTVTPGSTAPETSFTSPAMVLVCANTAAGISMRHAAAIIGRAKLRMRSSLQEVTGGFSIAVAKNCRFHALKQRRAAVRSWGDFKRQLQLNFVASKIPDDRFSKTAERAM